MRALAAREQTIMRLRFFEGLTQREIAERVGISQMHVSRLIRRSLEDMRARMADPDEQPRDGPAAPCARPSAARACRGCGAPTREARA